MTIVDFYAENTPGTVAPRDFVLGDGASVAANIEDDPLSPIYGHFTNGYGVSRLTVPDNSQPQGVRLEVEAHKQTWLPMGAGLINTDPVAGLAMCRLTLQSIEAWLSFRSDHMGISGLTGPDGSFPAQKGGSAKKQHQYHNKTIAAAPIADALLNFKQSSFYTGADATWCDTLVSQMQEFSDWLMVTPDTDEFILRTTNYNQAASVVFFLEAAGVLHGNSAMRDRAKAIMQQIMAAGIQQTATTLSNPGVIYERYSYDTIGFDGSYMNFSLRSFIQYYLLLDASTWKTEVEAQLLVCVERWLETVNIGTGLVTATPDDLLGDPRPWTRVQESGPTIPTLTVKGWTYDHIPFGVLMMNYVFGNSVVPDTLPDLITEQGQNFGKTPPEDPVNFIILGEADIASVEGMSATVDWAALGRAERQGGGACVYYPGGILPNPCFILSTDVLYLPQHASHAAALGTLPVLDINMPGFPAAL